jgi:hypothetical protein
MPGALLWWLRGASRCSAPRRNGPATSEKLRAASSLTQSMEDGESQRALCCGARRERGQVRRTRLFAEASAFHSMVSSAIFCASMMSPTASSPCGAKHH